MLCLVVFGFFAQFAAVLSSGANPSIDGSLYSKALQKRGETYTPFNQFFLNRVYGDKFDGTPVAATQNQDVETQPGTQPGSNKETSNEANKEKNEENKPVIKPEVKTDDSLNVKPETQTEKAESQTTSETTQPKTQVGAQTEASTESSTPIQTKLKTDAKTETHDESQEKKETSTLTASGLATSQPEDNKAELKNKDFTNKNDSEVSTESSTSRVPQITDSVRKNKELGLFEENKATTEDSKSKSESESKTEDKLKESTKTEESKDSLEQKEQNISEKAGDSISASLSVADPSDSESKVKEDKTGAVSQSVSATISGDFSEMIEKKPENKSDGQVDTKPDENVDSKSDDSMGSKPGSGNSGSLTTEKQTEKNLVEPEILPVSASPEKASDSFSEFKESEKAYNSDKLSLFLDTKVHVDVHAGQNGEQHIDQSLTEQNHSHQFSEGAPKDSNSSDSPDHSNSDPAIASTSTPENRPEPESANTSKEQLMSFDSVHNNDVAAHRPLPSEPESTTDDITVTTTITSYIKGKMPQTQTVDPVINKATGSASGQNLNRSDADSLPSNNGQNSPEDPLFGTKPPSVSNPELGPQKEGKSTLKNDFENDLEDFSEDTTLTTTVTSTLTLQSTITLSSTVVSETCSTSDGLSISTASRKSEKTLDSSHLPNVYEGKASSSGLDVLAGTVFVLLLILM